MEIIPQPVFSMVLGYLGLKDLEVLARCSPSLFQTVLHDWNYHRQVRKILVCLEKQWRYFEIRNSTEGKGFYIDKNTVQSVEYKYKSLLHFYDSFTHQGHEMITTKENEEKLVPIFPHFSLKR